MDSFELNKIAGAILATALGVMVLSIVSETIFHPSAPAQPGYVVAGVDATGDHGVAAEEIPPISVRLVNADVAAGEQVFARCRTCHTTAEGDLRRMPGPNLYDIVGAPVAHLEGFPYSSAFQEDHAEGKVWTYEYLDDFLTNPRATIPGTAMTFLGLRRADERANVVAYLRSLSNDPEPLPEPPVAEVEEPAEPPALPPGAAPTEPVPQTTAPVQVEPGEPTLPPAEAQPAAEPPASAEPSATQAPAAAE